MNCFEWYCVNFSENLNNIDVLEHWIKANGPDKVAAVYEAIVGHLHLSAVSESAHWIIQKKAEMYDWALRRKWKTCGRQRRNLERHHSTWLYSDLLKPDDLSRLVLNRESTFSKENPSSSLGRPYINFEDASRKTKIRRVKDLLSRPSTELAFAAELTRRSENRSVTIDCSSRVATHEIISLVLDLDLSERKYQILRSFGSLANQLPSVKALRQLKKSFLPEVSASDTSAEVKLQDVLNKTCESIAKLADLNDYTDMTLICKWGFDGSSSHSTYKLPCTESLISDEFLFSVAFVPLKLVGGNRDLWVNPHPSSTLYCRPIKFLFLKENEALIREQESQLSTEIQSLSPYRFNTRNCDTWRNITFQFHFTMLDGKVANILSETKSSSKCYICKATPKEMNTTKVYERIPDTDQYRFGLSTLHCWIRFFECLLHISYRLPFKKWQVKGDDLKEIYEKNKKRIQESFKSRLSLTVDKPKPGFGSSNDGNTARTFFANSKVSAEITGLNEELIGKFHLILRTLSCGKRVNVDPFGILLKDTLKLYLDNYGWYYMPSSVHKVLFHSCEVINFFHLIPIGMLSEEALEATHKVIRKSRLNHTRKNSRANSNVDLLNHLLISSDPLISASRKTSHSNSKLKLEDIKKYLLDADEDEDESSWNSLQFELENLPSEESTSTSSDSS